MQPFFIEYFFNNKSELAEVKPCCDEKNIRYYDIAIGNEYQFTITPVADKDLGMVWKVSLKNADKHVDPALVELIGQAIEKHILS